MSADYTLRERVGDLRWSARRFLVRQFGYRRVRVAKLRWEHAAARATRAHNRVVETSARYRYSQRDFRELSPKLARTVKPVNDWGEHYAQRDRERSEARRLAEDLSDEPAIWAELHGDTDASD